MIAKNELEALLEESLNKMLILDLSSRHELFTPYVRYIFEHYFASLEEQSKVNEIIHFVGSLNLDVADVEAVKLLALLHAGEKVNSRLVV